MHVCGIQKGTIIENLIKLTSRKYLVNVRAIILVEGVDYQKNSNNPKSF